MTSAQMWASYGFLAALVLLGLVILPLLVQRWAGPTLIILGRPRLQRSWWLEMAAFWAAFFALWSIYLFLWRPRATHHPLGSPFLDWLVLVVAGGNVILLLSRLLGRWRITERGLTSYVHRLPWDRIASYAWEDALSSGRNATLTIQFSDIHGFVADQLTWSLSERERRAALQLLSQHLGRIRPRR